MSSDEAGITHGLLKIGCYRALSVINAPIYYDQKVIISKFIYILQFYKTQNRNMNATTLSRSTR